MSDKIALTGLCYPNFYGHYLLLAMEEVLGRNGVRATLNLAELRTYIDNPPPNNPDRAFDMANMTRLLLACIEMGGRVMGAGNYRRSARQFFLRSYQEGLLSAPASPSLPGIFTALLTYYLDFTEPPPFTLEEEDKVFIIRLQTCPQCWEQRPDTIPLRMGKVDPSPICWGLRGFLVEGLRRLTEREYSVVETECHAQGQPNCTYRIAPRAE
jgi:hypothetical protein